MRDSYPPVAATTDAQRVGMVQEIFATITGRYDFLNRLLSLRRDVAWRRFACRHLGLTEGGRFLDVATGTADLALEAARRYPASAVTGLDFVGEMLAAGKVKVARAGLEQRISLVRGDALALPFADGTFAAAAMAFGIRNIPDRPRALGEMRRVVVPGGRVLILEMTAPRTPFFRGAYRCYLERILPRAAGVFTLNPAAYRYLADSIMQFPSPREFARLMEEAGLERVQMHPLTLGVTWLHVGYKPKEGVRRS